VIGLSFHPVGEAFGDEGVFYAREEGVDCVVCGEAENFCLRKDIIPRIYREHFPAFMKEDSNQDLVLMCIRCYREAVDVDKEFCLDLAKSCNALPVGSAIKLSSDVTSQAAKVVDWMKAAYNGSLLEFERLWRQNFLEKMGPKHLPITWSLDHSQKEAPVSVGTAINPEILHKGSSVKKKLFKDLDQDINLSPGRAHGKLVRLKRALMRRGGGTVVKFLSYLDPIVVGFPSFIISRVVDHTKRLQKESPQRSLYDEIANFTKDPVLVKKVEDCTTAESKTPVLSFESIDFIGALWSGGIWTILRSVVDRAKERQILHPSQLKARHNMESLLAMWSVGLSVVTQELFAINLLTNENISKASLDIDPPPRLSPVNQNDEELDDTKTAPASGYPIDSILSLWTLGLWVWIKPLISAESQKDEGCKTPSELSPILETRHRTLAVLQQYESLLSLWSCGAWTLIHAVMREKRHWAEIDGKEKITKMDITINPNSELTKPIEKLPYPSISPSEAVGDMSRVGTPIDIPVGRFHDSFMSLWSFGLWSLVKSSFLLLRKVHEDKISSMPKVSQYSKATDGLTDGLTEQSKPAKADIETVDRQLPTFSDKIIPYLNQFYPQIPFKSQAMIQSTSDLLGVWSFGVWDLILMLINQDATRMKILNEGSKDKSTKEEIVEFPTKPTIKNQECQSTGLLYQGQPEEFFYAFWTLGLWPAFNSIQGTLSNLLFKFTRSLEKNEKQITSEQIQTPTADVSESDPHLPEQPVDLSLLDRTHEDSFVSSRTEELKSRELLDDVLPDGMSTNIEEKDVCKSEDVNLSEEKLSKFHQSLKIQQIIYVWTFGVWTLLRVLLSQSCVSMKIMEKDAKTLTNNSEINHETMQKEDEAISPVIHLKDQSKAKQTSEYLSEGQPEKFFYAFWTLGLWPSFSNVQVTLSHLLTKIIQSDEKNKEQITSKQIPTASMRESEPHIPDQPVDLTVLDSAHNEGSTISISNEEPNLVDRLDSELSDGVLTNFEEKVAFKKDDADQSKGNAIYFYQSLQIQQIISIWTFGVWTLLRVLQSKDCVSMKKMESDAETITNDMKHETNQKEGESISPMIDLKDQIKEEQSMRVSQIFEGRPDEFFFVFWSLGLWPVLSYFQNILSVFSLFSIYGQTAEKNKKEIQLPGAIGSESDPSADQNSQSKIIATTSDNQPVKEESERDPDHGFMIGEKASGSSLPEGLVGQSVINKEKSDKRDTKLQIDSTVGSSEKFPDACENIDAVKTSFSQSAQDFIFSSEMQRILSIWSFGLWTVLGVLKSKSCISISNVQKDAERTANYSEASFGKKQEKEEEISSDVQPTCGDQVAYYLFLISFGLLNHIVFFHELSKDLFQCTKSYVGMLNNKDMVMMKETVDIQVSDNASEDARTGKSTSFGAEKAIELVDNTIKKSLPETDFDLGQDDPTSMLNDKNTITMEETLDTITLKKGQTSEMGEGSLEEPLVSNDGVQYVHELGEDMDNKLHPRGNVSSEIGASPLIKKIENGESASLVSLLDVWTFGLWTTGKTLFHENIQSPRGLFLSLWSFGLWPLMIPSSSTIDDSRDIHEMTRGQEHVPASQTIETDKAPTECTLTKIETRNNEMLTLVMSIWTFGLWSTLKTILEEKSANRNVFDFLFNVWLFGVWPTSGVSGTLAVAKSDEDEDTAANDINTSPIISHSQDNQDEVIPAHDALLSFMSLGLWIPVKNLKELIMMKDEAAGQTVEAIQPVSNQSLMLYSALLSHWTCGLWSLLLGLVQGTRATVSTLESESLVSMDSTKKTAKLAVSGEKYHSDQQTEAATAMAQQRNSVEEQLFDLWTFGMYGLFRDLTGNIAMTDSSVSLAKSTNVLLSLWTFGLWNIMQNLNRKPENKRLDESTAAVLSNSTLEKKPDAACLDSMISMWTLGLWMQSKSVMTRIFEKEWSLNILQQWVLCISQMLRRESATKIVRDDPSLVIVDEEVMIDDANVECAVTPDSESYVRIPERGADSPLSEDYEELKLEFDDLVKKFLGKLELSTINAVYEEAHGIESVAYEILESMVDSQDSFVHYDGDGNEVFEGTSKTIMEKYESVKPTGLSKSTRLPVLKVVSSPLIASVKPDIPGAGIEKTKDLDNIDNIDLELKNVPVLKDMDRSDNSEMAKPKTQQYKIDKEAVDEKLRGDMKQFNMIETNFETSTNPSTSLEQKELSYLTSASATVVKTDSDDNSSPITGNMTEESPENLIVTESHADDERDGMQNDLLLLDTNLVKSIEEEHFVSYDSKTQIPIDFKNGKHQQTELTSVYVPHEVRVELSDGGYVQENVPDIHNSPNISDGKVITMKTEGPVVTDKVYLEEKQDALEYENTLTDKCEERAPQIASMNNDTEVSSNAFTTKERLSAVQLSDSVSYQSHLVDMKYKQTTVPEVQTSVCMELVKDLDVDKPKIQSSNVEQMYGKGRILDESVISVEQQLFVGNDISETMQHSLKEFSENNIPAESNCSKLGLTSKLENITLQDSEICVESNTFERIDTKYAMEEKETVDSFIKINTFKSDNLNMINNDINSSKSLPCEGTLDSSMEKKLAFTISAPAKGVEVEGSLMSESKNTGLNEDDKHDGNENSNKQEDDKEEEEFDHDDEEEEEGEEEDEDEEEDEEGDEEDLEEISKILALAKKMDGKKSSTDDDWLSKLAKNISKPQVEKESQAETEDNRDVFGDKEWDVCQESDDIANRPIKEYDLSSEAATSDAQGSLHEYDLISHSSSAVSLSDHSSTKESTPIKDSIEEIVTKHHIDVDDLATTPVVGGQVFQNLSIKEFKLSSETVTSDVFGDKEWDVCQESEDIANQPVKEYDLSSEAATSDVLSSSNEYDLISYSSSAVSFSDRSSTKELTPTKESFNKIDTKADTEADDLATTPVVVRRMFTSSAQRLNESLAEVDVTLGSSHTLIKKLSESTTSMDSNSSSSTIVTTGESVLPTVMVSEEEQSLSQNFPPSPITLEHHTIRQDITHLTQSRVLYRGKSPSQSRLSESSETGDIGININTQATATSTPAKHTLDTAHEESSDLTSNTNLFTSALDSQTESTDFEEVSNVLSDSETTSDAENEEVWVTETSEMVTSFVTETVKKTEIDEDGNEVVVETVRVLGSDGREVSPDMALLVRSPSFVSKS